MSNLPRFAVSLAAASLLAACGVRQVTDAPAVDNTNSVGEDSGDGLTAQAQGTNSSPNADAASDVPTVTASGPTLTPTPLPPAPDGWIEYQSAPLALTLHYPPGWEARPVDDRKVELREISGDGWIDINVVDPSNDEDFSLVYSLGASAEDLMGVIVSAAREEGEFEDPKSVDTRTGIPAITTEGTFELIAERELIAVMALPDRVLLAVGHAPIRDDVWDTSLIQTYETIVWTIRPEQPDF
jgi:hypothetical protein